MILAQLQLARGAHHAIALDAADRRLLQDEVTAGDIGARAAEHTDQAGAGIGCPADDLKVVA